MFGSLIGDVVKGITGIIGGNQAANATKDANTANAALQREFAQQGVQWRVEDAKKAGVHPLAALGAQIASASPSYVGDTSRGNALANMGQDIGNAVNRSMTKPDRTTMQLEALAIERGQLENELLRSQIAKNTSAGGNPPLPSAVNADMPGQGNYTVLPAQLTASATGRPAQEAGAINDIGFARTPTGLVVVPSTDMKQRMEDDIFQELSWNIRNRLVPSYSRQQIAPDPSQYPLPSGYDHWKWDSWHGEYRPAKSSNKSTPRGGHSYYK